MGSAVAATIPILLLIGIGYLTRALGLLQDGDERALNRYMYWLALPALFIHDLSQATLSLDTLRFMALGGAPAIGVGTLVLLLPRVSRDLRYLSAATTLPTCGSSPCGRGSAGRTGGRRYPPRKPHRAPGRDAASRVR